MFFVLALVARVVVGEEEEEECENHEVFRVAFGSSMHAGRRFFSSFERTEQERNGTPQLWEQVKGEHLEEEERNSSPRPTS